MYTKKGMKHVAAKGRHEKPEQEKPVGTKKRGKRTERPARKRAGLGVTLLRLVIVVLFALVMLSPLKGCVVSDEGCISAQDALDIAVRDSGVSPSLVTDVETDTSSIDGRLCLLVDFSAAGVRHRYVIDAVSAEIIAFDP